MRLNEPHKLRLHAAYLLQIVLNLAFLWSLLYCLEPMLYVEHFRSGQVTTPAVLTGKTWIELLILAAAYLGGAWMLGSLVFRRHTAGKLRRHLCGLAMAGGPLGALVCGALGYFAALGHIALWPVPVVGLLANLSTFFLLFRSFDNKARLAAGVVLL